MAIISGIHLLSREKVRKLVIEKWGIAFTEVVRSMDGGDYCTACLVCFQFQWDCIIFNRHIISMKSQGFFQTPQDIMEECNGCSAPHTLAREADAYPIQTPMVLGGIIFPTPNDAYIIERAHYPPNMRNKSVLIAIVMVSSSLAGCTSDNSEEDQSARYQEGYDAGYGDAYDASYDGVAQHHYNEGWDDGWAIANSDSEEIISDLMSNLSIQQNLVDEWIQNSIMNDFSGMNFSNFNMSGADLSGSNLTGANLTGANLQSVIWSNTICPDGSNSDDNGNTCANNL